MLPADDHTPASIEDWAALFKAIGELDNELGRVSHVAQALMDEANAVVAWGEAIIAVRDNPESDPW